MSAAELVCARTREKAGYGAPKDSAGKILAELLRRDYEALERVSVQKRRGQSPLARRDAAAFEIYFKLCAWFDANAKDGVVNADKIMIDTLANRFGCADSLEKSGWLSFDGETCTITTWQKDAGFQIW